MAAQTQAWFKRDSVPSRGTCWFMIVAAFCLSRILAWNLGVRFDAEPFEFYWQFIDPNLLRHDLLRSLFYWEQQPPLFNFFLGAVPHLVPAHEGFAFAAAYVCIGLAMAIALFALMDRMGVDQRLATLIAVVFAANPSTILYENLLFYEYPLAALWCVAALFLHRYATSGRFSDGLIFFSSLASISGIRSIYHPLWFAAVALLIGFASRKQMRRTLQAAALPAIVLLLFYGKHALVFHNLVPGGSMQSSINLSLMIRDNLGPDELDSLVAAGKVPRVFEEDIVDRAGQLNTEAGRRALSAFLPPPPASHIAILDECIKSTGAINWNCTWLENLSVIYEKSSLTAISQDPALYLTYLPSNLERYFLPDTKGWPFDSRERDTNSQTLRLPLALYNFALTGDSSSESGRPWLSYVALPGLLGLGLLRVMQGRRKMSPAWLTIAFMTANMIYLGVLTILLSYGDQNRYRSELGTYFAVLLGICLTDFYRKLTRRRAA
jgi:hypothetical protein